MFPQSKLSISWIYVHFHAYECIFIDVHQTTLIFSNVHRYSYIFIDSYSNISFIIFLYLYRIWRCSLIFKYFHIYSNNFIKCHICLWNLVDFCLIFTDMRTFSFIFKHVHRNSLIFTRHLWYSCIFTDFHDMIQIGPHGCHTGTWPAQGSLRKTQMDHDAAKRPPKEPREEQMHHKWQLLKYVAFFYVC